MDRLLGHLAQFASFWKQSELLCTQGLAYLLRDDEGERLFCGLVSEAAGVAVRPGLVWRAESLQDDGGRPDLEGCTENGSPVVKVEAKLGAGFGMGQLMSYVNAFGTEGSGVLVILVPEFRREETAHHVCASFDTTGSGPWVLSGRTCQVPAAVLSWEEVFEALGSVSADAFRNDLAQVHAMYRVFNGDDMEPITSDEEVLAWRDREEWWGRLVDLVTRRLTAAGENVMPIGLESGSQPYYRRYVCRQVADGSSCYSIGTRDPFRGHQTPIWLRFHNGTGSFDQITRNLEASGLSDEAVWSEGHRWFPLEVPLNAERSAMIEQLVSQAQRIVDAAYGTVIQDPAEWRSFQS